MNTLLCCFTKTANICKESFTVLMGFAGINELDIFCVSAIPVRLTFHPQQGPYLIIAEHDELYSLGSYSTC